jgi:hypothetical protein
MNAYVSIEPGTGRSSASDVRVTILITVEAPTMLDAVKYTADVLQATNGGDVRVASISAYEAQVQAAMADALSTVRGLRVRRS